MGVAMYCWSCGSAVKPTLSYCNRCGAKLSGTKSDGVTTPAELSPLVAAIVAAFVFGLGVTIGLMFAMKMVGFNPGLITALTLLSFLLMLVIEGVFIWMLLSRKRGAKEGGDTARLKEQAAKELGAAREQVLPEPGPSITEHTTREFEPALPKPPKIHE